MSGGQGATETQSTKVEQKSLKKTLDKLPYLWYNTGTRGEEMGVAFECEGVTTGCTRQDILPTKAKRKKFSKTP